MPADPILKWNLTNFYNISSRMMRSHYDITSSRFSQNSCLGFSWLPCFKSCLTLLSIILYTVTGCLNIDAVWRMGGTKETSVRTPLLQKITLLLPRFTYAQLAKNNKASQQIMLIKKHANAVKVRKGNHKKLVIGEEFTRVHRDMPNVVFLYIFLRCSFCI